MIYIKIDARERDLIAIMQAKLDSIKKELPITITVESLPLGDIILCNDEEELLIIERKTVADLGASIKDGRYQEQSYRLHGHPVHNHNIAYLIEGAHRQQSCDQAIFYSALFSLHYYKGFSVWRSFSLDETATIICSNAKYLAKTAIKTGFYNSGEIIAKDYVSVIKTVKKDNITPANIGEIMLCQIPGISANSAKAIMAHFKTLSDLIADLQEHGEKCLDVVQLLNAKGSGRKLNKTCIANIIAYLLQ